MMLRPFGLLFGSFLTSLGCLLRDLAPSLCGQLGRLRLATLLGEFSGGTFFLIGHSVLDLTSSDIDDELPELDRVTRAFDALRTHAGNVACCQQRQTHRQAGVGRLLQLN